MSISWIFYIKARTVLLACLELSSVCLHETPTPDKMDSPNIKDISAVIHLGSHAIHTAAVDIPYHLLLRFLCFADFSPSCILCLDLYYQIGATSCRKLDLEKAFSDARVSLV